MTLSYRYACFSVTGYPMNGERGPRGPYGRGRRAWAPLTTWYVVDLFNCAEVVYETPWEQDAKDKRWRMNARQRRLDKEQERA
jgi:hypothetical protein